MNVKDPIKPEQLELKDSSYGLFGLAVLLQPMPDYLKTSMPLALERIYEVKRHDIPRKCPKDMQTRHPQLREMSRHFFPPAARSGKRPQHGPPEHFSHQLAYHVPGPGMNDFLWTCFPAAVCTMHS